MPRRVTPVCLAALLLLAGCGEDKQPPPPAPQPSAASNAPAPALESRAVDAGGDKLTMTMTPLIRSGDTVGVYTVAEQSDGGRCTRVVRPGLPDREGRPRCLCDRLLNQPIPAGAEQVIALWFPAPPPGTTTIAIDVPDKLHITGLPIA